MANSKYEQDGPRVLSTAGRGETFAEIMARRLSRRGLIQGGAAASAIIGFAAAITSRTPETSKLPSCSGELARNGRGANAATISVKSNGTSSGLL